MHKCNTNNKLLILTIEGKGADLKIHDSIILMKTKQVKYCTCTYTHTVIQHEGKLAKYRPRRHPGGWQLNTDYDGILGRNDAPEGVWFSTTLYNGGFPTITPYPTGGTLGQRYWRLFVKLNHLNLHDDAKWNLYFVEEKNMSGGTTERVIAFVHPNDTEFFENAQQLDKQRNQHMFYMENQQGQIEWRCPMRPIWTKIFIKDDIDLTNLQHPVMFWDTVEKTQGV